MASQVSNQFTIERPVVNSLNAGPIELVNFHNMLSGNSRMFVIFENIRKAATVNVPICISGETGTGKELVARACHLEGSSTNRPFVAVNCANFSEQLMESQLFGHKKGAFTGATSNQIGLFEAASDGTLFLDEITTLSLPLQAKLLRVLQEREYTPLGSHKLMAFNARIITASSTPLSQATREGYFRDDLFYRLGVISINLPPLRQRNDDKTQLAEYFIQCLSESELEGQNKHLCYFSEDALRFIQSYHWPGNVRQLRNVILAALVLNDCLEITALTFQNQIIDTAEVVLGLEEDLALPLPSLSRAEEIQVQPLWWVEKQTIEKAIFTCSGNIPKAAALLEISPSTIYRKIQSWQQKAH